MESIIGIGTDIQEIRKFDEELGNRTFLKKVFTEKEIEYCMRKEVPSESFAARFCAKESLIKS